MTQVTSKLQVTIPKALARLFGIQPGDEISWAASASAILLVPRPSGKIGDQIPERLRLFDEATGRQEPRNGDAATKQGTRDRGWKRADIYSGGRRSAPRSQGPNEDLDEEDARHPPDHE